MKTAFNRIAKTITLAAFAFITFTASAFVSPIDVSNNVSRQFEQQFRGASNVTWKTTAQFTSASFIQDGQTVSVFYTPAGDFTAVSKVITVNDLPKKAQQKLAAQYSSYTVVSVINYTDAEDTTMYYVQLEKNGQSSILQADETGSISTFQK